MIEPRPPRHILVLGASGLIGRFITDDLRERGFAVTGVARRFATSQITGDDDLALSVMAMHAAALTQLLNARAVDLVVNCLGVLQDGPGSDTNAVHRDFVATLLQAIRASSRAIRLVHLSIPGAAGDDHTAFSRTKREAEQLIAASGVSHTILRPGFVIAPSAYGGSAMLRALATLPVDLPATESATLFQPVAVADIAATVAWLAAHGDMGDATWELMQPEPVTLGGVIAQFRRAFGTAAWPRMAMPGFMLDLGARLGDATSCLGWMPPMRSTAIAELRRGVRGDPAPWMAATGIVPLTIAKMVGSRTATIQDKWFARLFLVKALSIASLSVFWIASGFIAVALSLPATKAILASHDFPPAWVAPFAIGTSLMDISIGVLIAFRRSCAAGLVIGMLVSLGYMAGCAVLTPDLWLEPLGALVKTGPAIVLMAVALLTLDNR
ncbi:SDR family oxidoreductase [soil metagenome]